MAGIFEKKNDSAVTFPKKQSTKRPQTIWGKFRALFEAKCGSRIWIIQGLLCTFSPSRSDPKKMGKMAPKIVKYYSTNTIFVIFRPFFPNFGGRAGRGICNFPPFFADFRPGGFPAFLRRKKNLASRELEKFGNFSFCSIFDLKNATWGVQGRALYGSIPVKTETFRELWAPLVHTFSWGNMYGPMVLKALLKLRPTLALAHGYLFPDAAQGGTEKGYALIGGQKAVASYWGSSGYGRG